MRLSVLLAEQIGTLFLVALVGYGIVKFQILSEQDSKVVSWLVAYILSPCVIIKSFQIDFTQEKLRGLGLTVAAAFLAQAIFMAGAKLLERPLHLTSIERASVIYSNCGYLIIPLVSYVLGKDWVFYTSAYVAVFNILAWTHLPFLLGGGKGRVDFTKIILNPNIISIAVGFLLFFGKFRIPAALENTIEGLGDAAGALSMLVVGMLIGNMDLKWVFTRKRPYLICAFRLVVFPVLMAVIYAGLAHLGIHPQARQLLLVSLLAASAPVAVMITQLTQLYGGDARYAGVINVVSVIFCIVTMPLVVLLYEILC